MDQQDAKDILLAVLHEYYSRLQHYEIQRSTVSNLLVIVAAAILAFVTFDKALTIADLPLIFLLMLVGLFGAAFCAKYYERAALLSDRIQRVRSKLDELFLDSTLLQSLQNDADHQHAKEFPKFHGGVLTNLKVNVLWILFHLVLALLGLILIVLIRFV